MGQPSKSLTSVRFEPQSTKANQYTQGVTYEAEDSHRTVDHVHVGHRRGVDFTCGIAGLPRCRHLALGGAAVGQGPSEPTPPVEDAPASPSPTASKVPPEPMVALASDGPPPSGSCAPASALAQPPSGARAAAGPPTARPASPALTSPSARGIAAAIPAAACPRLDWLRLKQRDPAMLMPPFIPESSKEQHR